MEVTTMETRVESLTLPKVGRKPRTPPIRAIAAPFLALGYIIILPAVGIIGLILMVGYELAKGLAKMLR
jgi:hypothetical protein